MPILKSTDNMEKRKGSDLNLVSALSNSLSSRHGSMPILRLLFFAFFEGSYFSRIDRSSMRRGAPSSCPIWRCSGRLDVRCCMKNKKKGKRQNRRLLFFAFFEGSYFSRIDRSSMLRGAPSSCPIWRCSGRLDVRCCMKKQKKGKRQNRRLEPCLAPT